MDSSKLERYLDSLQYPYVKAYGDRSLEYLGADTNYLSRIFTNGGIFIQSTYSMLFFRFNNIDDLNQCRRYIRQAGFTLDSVRTSKVNIEVGDKIESYTLGNIEIQLSDNDFQKNIKVVGASAPMSAYFGQGVHMFSLLIRNKDQF
jgi:hypothetical protein